MWRAGANVVAAGEAEVGVSLVDAVITTEDIGRGATAEQRARVRRRLYGMDEAQPSAPKA